MCVLDNSRHEKRVYFEEENGPEKNGQKKTQKYVHDENETERERKKVKKQRERESLVVLELQFVELQAGGKSFG